MTEELLRIDGLHVGFRDGDAMRPVVRGVDLRIAPGEVVGLVGESGSGKSMTALALMRLLPLGGAVTSGRIIFKGRDLREASVREVNKLRGGQIGMIFQDPLTALNPAITIGGQLTDTIRAHQPLGRKAAMARAEELLSLVGIPYPRQRLLAYPHELSGGMRQRVMIALAVSCNPSLLIADEPTTALDVTVQAQILDLLLRLRADFGSSVLLITHDMGVVARVADRVVVMYAGNIAESGATAQIFAHPRHPYTIGLLAAIPRLHGEKLQRLPAIPGAPPPPHDRPAGCAFAPRCPYSFEKCAEKPPLALVDGHQAACFRAGEL